MNTEYQKRTLERLLDTLRAGDQNPRSWQQEAADLIVHLNAVADAGREMPRATPRPGGASTIHDFKIQACHVWGLDLALKRLDALSSLPPPVKEKP